MERRRRGLSPFERLGALTPIIRTDLLAPENRVNRNEHKPDRGAIGNERSVRGDRVPAMEGIGIIRDATWHALQAEEMHREEGQVDADEGQPEMQFARPFRISAAT